jgi:peroxin-3
MALLPTLGKRIIEGMNVEEVTEQLQSLSRASKAASAKPLLPPALSDSSVSSGTGVQVQVEDAKSDNDSVSVVSAPGQDDSTGTSRLNSSMAESSMSWVDQLSLSTPGHSTQPSHEHSPEASGSEPRQQSHSPKSNVGTELSDSIVSGSSVSYGDIAVRILPILVEIHAC